jgi:predicted XRE-type DNA-binding protein
MAQKRSGKMKVDYTTGSVFHALGLPDADDLVVKAELVACVERIIRERGLTQVQAAALLGMDQPKVSAMLRGKLDRFSIERLIRALRDLGQDVRLTVGPASRRRSRGRLVVSAAA